MNIRSALAALALSAATAAGASAQPSVQAVFGASLDQVDRNAAAVESSSAPAGTFSLEQYAFEERLRLFYDFDGGTFTSEGDWHYLQHGAGARYQHALGQRTALYVGGTAALRTNGDSWSAASYRAGGVFGNVEHDFGRGTFRAGVRADRRVFDDQPELDQWELGTFASLRRSFQTRTTLIGEVGLGWKRFDEGVRWVEVTPVPAATPGTGTPTGGAATGGAPGGNSGNGFAGSGNAGSTTSPGGPWMRPSFMASSALETTGGERAQMVTLFGRVAQSLADQTSATLDLTWRDASGAVATALVTTPEMLIDDGVYDDPFASDAIVVRLGLKRIFDGGRSLEGGASHWSKDYDATPAFDASGAVIAGQRREDDVWRLEASWREPLAPGRTGDLDLAMIASYTYMDSASTDAYYTYRSHRVRAMLSISY